MWVCVDSVAVKLSVNQLILKVGTNPEVQIQIQSEIQIQIYPSKKVQIKFDLNLFGMVDLELDLKVRFNMNFFERVDLDLNFRFFPTFGI